MDNNSQQSDDFGAFLESVQRAVKPGEVGGSTANMKIMNMLAKLGEVDMAQLVAMVELPWSDFTTGVESLKSAGLVIVNETTQGGKVQLTSDGQRWASALNSPNQEG
jgi:predicted transcriptional regulator